MILDMTMTAAMILKNSNDNDSGHEKEKHLEWQNSGNNNEKH